jgi:hypothetical protein
MGFEYDARFVLKSAGHAASLIGFVEGDSVVSEFHARLDHDRDDAGRRIANARLLEGASMFGQRRERSLRGRRLDRVDSVMGPLYPS